MRHRAKLSLVLSVLALLILAGCSKLRARDELNKGVRAYKAGQFEAAITHFQKSIELDPELLNARIYLATAYAAQCVPQNPSPENQQLCEAAIREFENVLEKDPHNVTALSYIASLYYGLGDAEIDFEKQLELYDKSKEYRKRLIEGEPQNPEHYYSIGVIQWKIAARRSAELRRKLKLTQDVPLPARERRQLAEQNTAVVEEGITVLQKAIDINPKYVDAIVYLNLMYRQKADIVDTPQEREKYLQAAEEMFERQKKLREEMQGAPVAPAAK